MNDALLTEDCHLTRQVLLAAEAVTEAFTSLCVASVGRTFEERRATHAELTHALIALAGDFDRWNDANGSEMPPFLIVHPDELDRAGLSGGGVETAPSMIHRNLYVVWRGTTEYAVLTQQGQTPGTPTTPAP